MDLSSKRYISLCRHHILLSLGQQRIIRFIVSWKMTLKANVLMKIERCMTRIAALRAKEGSQQQGHGPMIQKKQQEQ